MIYSLPLRHQFLCGGSGVIWNGIHFEVPVIPAKAGIQSVDSLFPRTSGVDSRFRANDCGLQRPCPANDTTTHTDDMPYHEFLGHVRIQYYEPYSYALQN